MLRPVTTKKDPVNYEKYLIVEGFGIFSAEKVSQPCVTCLSVFAVCSALSKMVYNDRTVMKLIKLNNMLSM